MSKTTTLNTPRLVGAFVLALGLLVAGLAVGLGPADAVINGGSGGPSITELNWDCDEFGVCSCSGEADCKALRAANPDCRGWIFWDPDWMCTVPDGEPIFHPDGAPNPESGPGAIGPGDLPGAENTDTLTEPEQPENPETPETPEAPETPETPEQPPTELPPGIDPGDILKPGDLPGTVDPGPRSGSAESGDGLDLPGIMS